MAPNSADPSPDNPSFLPDFCAVGSVLVLVLVAELLSLVLTLATHPNADFWSGLSLTSLFIQWVSLVSAALLCVGRRWLARLDGVTAALAVWLLVMLVCGALSVAVYHLPTVHLATMPMHLFVLRNLAIAAIISAALLRHLYIQYQRRNNLVQETRARIQALQSRIRPHFLFNSMNTIASLTRSDPRTAERVVVDLADLFRFTLADAATSSSLHRELHICRQYLDIEKLRLGERLQVRFDTDGLPDCPVPALILQPLVENAVYHGIEQSADGGRIDVIGMAGPRFCEMTISNSCPEQEAGPRRQGNRMALDNVRQRLEVFFGGQARVRIDRETRRFAVHLAFPRREMRP